MTDSTDATPMLKNAQTSVAARPLRVGFIALTDAAPIIVAHEHGFFRRCGLSVELSREVGWATIRDKILYRELDAAHALGAMLVSTSLGLNCVPTDCLTACVLSQHGSCLTLSEDLWKAGVRDAATLRDLIQRTRGERTFVFGVVFAHSSHRIQFADWLKQAGIDPEKHVRIVVVPPPQLFRNLSAGTIDGYCAGEPWNSLAVRERLGWIAAAGPDLAPAAPDKVLMVRGDFAQQRGAEHLALVAALTAAAELCDQPEFRPELVKLLARPEYLNVPERVIAPALVGPLDLGHGRTSPVDDLLVFHRHAANDPKPARAEPLLAGFVRRGLLPAGRELPANLATRLFRSDLHQQALRKHAKSYDTALV